MLTIEVREVPIRLSVPIRKCDGCGGIDETATTVLRRGPTGAYVADPALPIGWNTLSVGSHSLDLCDRCSAAAVLERRQAVRVDVTTGVTAGPAAPTIVDAILGPETPAATSEPASPIPPNGGGHGKNKKPTAAKEA